LGDQFEHDQAQIALVEDPAATSAAAMMVVVTAAPISPSAGFVPEGVAGMTAFVVVWGIVVWGIAMFEFEH
jgi:hypothetical protein